MSAVIEQFPPQLRPMQIEDLPEVMEIEKASYEFPWTKGIFMDCLKVGYPGWIYEEAGEVLGYTVLSVAAGECHLLNLCVKPEAQRRGIGKILLEGAVETARRFQAEQIFLEVRASNVAARMLYHQFGFNQVGKRRKYYPARNGREDGIILALTLSDD